ncbi:hypothetical protein CBR_g30474 [Chara braunii]|uniref:Reverse transcriptase domain-containing protein n=1 Tax=Chara braunii TaxID=69332 RepID=A0A388LCR2_CHABU|nr:hypothetical protein CBR_g30474 [Chara braunii]|eukprot:GBG80107.1 hypothetical protein CBR_g30474 [Chara braunii]
MGICNAPATFQRAKNVTFQNFINKTRLTQGIINFCVIVYMDDILVYSETYHGHAQHIEWTLGALRDAGFKIIALEKSDFFLSEILFLCYVVTRGGVRPDSRKISAVREAPVPTSLTQVRVFLGLASYYRRFIKGFAAIARPLTRQVAVLPCGKKQIGGNGRQRGVCSGEVPIRRQSAGDDTGRSSGCPSAIGSRNQPHVYAARSPYSRSWQWRLWRKHFVELSVCLVGIRITWARDEDHREWSEYLEWLIIQAWRTDVEGDLLGFLFGSVRPSHRHPIVLELTVPLAQLADDLSLEIVSQSDENPVPHVLTRTLAPYLQWSACLEEPGNNCNPPSQRDYLSQREIIDLAYFRDQTATEDEAVATEEEAAEEEEEAEEETPEEGCYSEHSEGEQSEEEEEEEEQDDEEEEEEDQEELENSEWEGFEEEVRTEAREQAQAQKR